MEQSERHKVIFTPRYYSDLQPIETIWAILRGEVGRQHTMDSTFKVVLVRLKLSFDDFRSEAIQGCINKSNWNLEKLWKTLDTENAMDKEDDGFESVSEESDDGIDKKRLHNELGVPISCIKRIVRLSLKLQIVQVQNAPVLDVLGSGRIYPNQDTGCSIDPFDAVSTTVNIKNFQNPLFFSSSPFLDLQSSIFNSKISKKESLPRYG